MTEYNDKSPNSLQKAYATFRPGSVGFVTFVETHCGLEISRKEIRRIALATPTAEDFYNAWGNESWWLDCHEDTAMTYNAHCAGPF
jgi:hypothetical protein